jgi:hypothetical protein
VKASKADFFKCLLLALLGIGPNVGWWLPDDDTAMLRAQFDMLRTFLGS